MAAVTMGGIGIWCMHFVGNHAIILHDGAIETHISYDSGFTALSFFLPICMLIVAFYFIGVTERADSWYIIFAGILTGASACGMHYVGQLGISNYKCTYKPGYVVGASLIAVAASITALGVFFRLRASWTNSWWKRGLCAMVLAMAVAGMHYTASAGTSYHSKGSIVHSSGQLTPTQTVVVCTVLVSLHITTSQQVSSYLQKSLGIGLCCMYLPPYPRYPWKPAPETIGSSCTPTGPCLCILRLVWADHGVSRRESPGAENHGPIR